MLNCVNMCFIILACILKFSGALIMKIHETCTFHTSTKVTGIGISNDGRNLSHTHQARMTHHLVLRCLVYCQRSLQKGRIKMGSYDMMMTKCCFFFLLQFQFLVDLTGEYQVCVLFQNILLQCYFKIGLS